MLLPCVPLNELVLRLTPQHDGLARALALPSAWQRAWLDAPSAPWRLLVRLVANLPASAAHHECGSGGLARHLLRTAQGSVERLRAARAADAAAAAEGAQADDAPLDDAQQEARERVVIALAASLRAVGVIWRQEVQACPGGPLWPRLRYLSDWAQEQHATQLSVVWTPGVRGGADGHGALGAALLALVLPPALSAQLGPAGLSRVLALVVAGAPPAQEAELQILATAAAQARQEGLICAVAGPLPGDLAGPILTTAGVCRAWVRERLAAPGQALAAVDAPALCSPTHTILFLGTDPGRSLLPGLMLRLRPGGPAPAGSEPGASWTPMLALLRELAAQQLPDETAWCVPADRDCGDAADGVIHHLVVTDPQRGLTRRCPAIILRNRVLWEALPRHLPRFAGVVRCCRDRRGVASVDAEELGFVGAPECPGMCSPAARHAPMRVASRMLEAADTLRDLPEVVRDLVAVTTTLGRTLPSAAPPAHGQLLLGALPQPLPAALLGDVLEAVVDQLHDLCARSPVRCRAPRRSATPASS